MVRRSRTPAAGPAPAAAASHQLVVRAGQRQLGACRLRDQRQALAVLLVAGRVWRIHRDCGAREGRGEAPRAYEAGQERALAPNSSGSTGSWHGCSHAWWQAWSKGSTAGSCGGRGRGSPGMPTVRAHTADQHVPAMMPVVKHATMAARNLGPGGKDRMRRSPTCSVLSGGGGGALRQRDSS